MIVQWCIELYNNIYYGFWNNFYYCNNIIWLFCDAINTFLAKETTLNSWSDAFLPENSSFSYWILIFRSNLVHNNSLQIYFYCRMTDSVGHCIQAESVGYWLLFNRPVYSNTLTVTVLRMSRTNNPRCLIGSKDTATNFSSLKFLHGRIPVDNGWAQWTRIIIY